MSRTYIEGLLAAILREAKYDYTDHRGERKETYTLVDFHGMKSQTIHGALEGNASIPYVMLVRPGNIKGLDAEGLVSPREERMKLVIRATPEQTPGLLKKINPWAKDQGWKDVRVQVDLPENRSKWVSIAREADAADILFVRSVQVSVTKRLNACTEKVNEELVAKAKELFVADGL